MNTPAKIHRGDPLFSALTKQWHIEDKEETNSSRGLQDPSYIDLIIHSPKATLPLHSYYSEYRLGHGDPLMKAAMKRWPFTTVPDDNDRRLRVPLSRALALSPCNALLDPSAIAPARLPHDIIHMDDVGHLEHSGGEDEHRFVLLSDERRFVVVEE